MPLKEVAWRWDDDWVVVANSKDVQFEWSPNWPWPDVPILDDPEDETLEPELETARW
jgi:hypothetical protein